MSKEDTARFFDEKVSQGYDERAEKNAPIMDNLHMLIGFVLDDLPDNARILCVGAGTGTEIIKLAKAHKNWHFTAIEPAKAMLDICCKKIEDEGIDGRCEVFHGYLADFQNEEHYDAVLCLLVTHFIKDKSERQALFTDMASRLKPAGHLITADISFDTETAQYPDMLEKWKILHRQSGAEPEHLDKMLETMKEHVAVLAPSEIAELFKGSGLPLPVPFFQSLLVHAWYAQRAVE